MKRISIMIKPASGLCNMRCQYCFYSNLTEMRQQASYGLMPEKTAAAVIKNVYTSLTAGDVITFAFQGGEPCLRGLDFYKFFTHEAKRNAPKGVRTNYTMQTNGLMINDEWCEFFKQNKFLIGLSIDGDAQLHNKNRRDSLGKGTFSRVMHTKKKLDEYRVSYNMLCVLTSEASRRAVRIWDFIVKENINYVQFIPCLEPLSTSQSESSFLEENKTTAQNALLNTSSVYLKSEKFFRFYSDLFRLWKTAALKGQIVHVNLFDDLTGLYLHNRKGTCGLCGICSPQIVVEANGDVYPCDFYVLDENRIGNLTNLTVKEIFDAILKSDFINRENNLPGWCKNCNYNTWCHGGCKRMVKSVYGANCGMKLFLDENLNELLMIIRQI